MDCEKNLRDLCSHGASALIPRDYFARSQGLSLVIVTVQNFVKTGNSGFTLNQPENVEWVRLLPDSLAHQR